MIGIDEQNMLFELIGKTAGRSIDVLVVGGSAMLYYNFSKTSTKDIDVVLLNEEDMHYFIKVVQGMGFRIRAAPEKQGHPYVLESEEFILDIFAGRIFRLELSEGVLNRVKERVEYGKLTVSVISPEDIILSKSMTDRFKDREDVMEITKEVNIDWNSILRECKWQAKNGDFRFCVYLYEFLDELVHDYGLKIPKDTEQAIKRLYRDFLDSIKTRK